MTSSSERWQFFKNQYRRKKMKTFIQKAIEKVVMLERNEELSIALAKDDGKQLWSSDAMDLYSNSEAITRKRN
jgi:hypothetical protein